MSEILPMKKSKLNIQYLLEVFGLLLHLHLTGNVNKILKLLKEKSWQTV
jgi:hypothetical protein